MNYPNLIFRGLLGVRAGRRWLAELIYKAVAEGDSSVACREGSTDDLRALRAHWDVDSGAVDPPRRPYRRGRGRVPLPLCRAAVIVASVSVVCLAGAPRGEGQRIAFPGAEGYGKFCARRTRWRCVYRDKLEGLGDRLAGVTGLSPPLDRAPLSSRCRARSSSSRGS